jgi:hypothetical protein
MRGANRARLSAEIQLHGIARPYFGYPPVEENAWYIPHVRRWEALRDVPPTASKAERKLVGALIVPSLVEWQVPPDHYFSQSKKENFKLHLQQRTGSRWEVDWAKLPYNVVVAERMSSVMFIRSPNEMETTRVDMPALPHPRQEFYTGIARGLFRDGWRRRSIEADRHREEDGA